MAIRFFVYALLLISSISILLSITSQTQTLNKTEQAQVVFNDSTMYTLTKDNISRVVHSTKVMRYKDRDIMYDGRVISKSGDQSSDYIQADVIVKRGNKMKFLNNVKYNRENNIILNTQELFYDTNTRIATNTVPFTGTYYDSKLRGESLYLDMNKSIFKAKKTHFNLKLDK